MSTNKRIEILLPAEQIAARVAELAGQINKEYAGKDILLLGTLKGAYIFMADLSRYLPGSTMIDFVKVSSYGDSTSPETPVKFEQHPSLELEGHHVLLVEDIVDTGNTLAYLRKYIQRQRPASLRVCALLDKPSRREVEVPVEYTGFTIPDEYVIGYGLDSAQRYRSLPYIGVYTPD